jgi:hypothetical protein
MCLLLLLLLQLLLPYATISTGHSSYQYRPW